MSAVTSGSQWLWLRWPSQCTGLDIWSLGGGTVWEGYETFRGWGFVGRHRSPELVFQSFSFTVSCSLALCFRCVDENVISWFLLLPLGYASPTVTGRSNRLK